MFKTKRCVCGLPFDEIQRDQSFLNTLIEFRQPVSNADKIREIEAQLSLMKHGIEFVEYFL